MGRRRANRPADLATWSGSLHQSFRILPTAGFGNEFLMAFLASAPGDTRDTVFERLRPHYDQNRAPETDDDDDEEVGPDPKRYRDLRQVFENCGLFWEDEHQRVHLTQFGRSLYRFMPHANQHNIGLMGQHAALALNVCQLRNPTGAGQRFVNEMRVFPYRFIWQAMLRLENRINSDELNRAIFATQNADMLNEAVERIRTYRRTGDTESLGPETVTGKAKNDRLIPIVCLASFGWTLLNQKEAGYYTIKPDCVRILQAAVSVPVEHQEYDVGDSVEEYVTRISNAACLPRDVR